MLKYLTPLNKKAWFYPVFGPNSLSLGYNLGNYTLISDLPCNRLQTVESDWIGTIVGKPESSRGMFGLAYRDYSLNIKYALSDGRVIRMAYLTVRSSIWHVCQSYHWMSSPIFSRYVCLRF